MKAGSIAEARTQAVASMRRLLAQQGIETPTPPSVGEQILMRSDPRKSTKDLMRQELQRMGIAAK